MTWINGNTSQHRLSARFVGGSRSRRWSPSAPSPRRPTPNGATTIADRTGVAGIIAPHPWSTARPMAHPTTVRRAITRRRWFTALASASAYRASTSAFGKLTKSETEAASSDDGRFFLSAPG